MAEGALGPDGIARIVDPISGARATMRAAGDSRYALSETGGDVGAAQTGRFGGTAGLAWIADQTGIPEDQVRRVALELVEFVRRTVGAEAAGALREGLPPSDAGAGEEAGPRLDHGAW
jgi:hypothetical protein